MYVNSQRVVEMVSIIVRLLALLGLFHIFVAAAHSETKKTMSMANSSTEHVQPAVDHQSGLLKAEGFNLVLAHCSACHSPTLITQNAMSRGRWLETIRWMQDTQKLWPLGEAEPVILDYLSTWYGPKQSARRAPLTPHLLPAN